MCHIKTNEKIDTLQDLQNLITAIILRQQDLYTKEYVCKATDHYLQGSKLNVSHKEIYNIISDTITTINRFDGSQNNYYDGVYRGSIPSLQTQA